MDFNLGDGRWRTIGVQDARDALKDAKARNSKTTRKDLADLLSTPADPIISDSDSEDDSTMVEVSDAEEEPQNKQDKNYTAFHTLSVVTANARSLAPKLESLFDCLSERQADLGMITETWLKPGRQLTDLAEELDNAYSLSIISRSRTATAINGRTYGGVAFIYRKSRGTFKEFAISNPANYEVLATVGKVKGVKNKIFFLTCYAPPPIWGV